MNKLKYILFLFFVYIIVNACTAKEQISIDNITEYQPLTLLSKDIQPGDTLTFYATLIDNDYKKYNGLETPELFTSVKFYSNDRSVQQVQYLSLRQRQKDENKFYGTFIVPKNIRQVHLYPGKKELGFLALDSEIYPIKDSISAYMKSRYDLLGKVGTDKFLSAFKQIRKEHPHNLEAFVLYWQVFKSSKEMMEKDIDSLARIFPGHLHLTELRLIPNIVFFDSTKAMEGKIKNQLDTLLQRDSLALFFSPVFKDFLPFLGKELIIEKQSVSTPFNSYLFAFAKHARSAHAFPWLAEHYNSKISKAIPPSIIFDLYNFIPKHDSDPMIMLQKSMYILDYVRMKKLPKDSLLRCEQYLKKSINIVFYDNFIESDICHTPLHLWMIRYWLYQNLNYALKMQGKLQEAKDSLLVIHKNYPILHDRQGEILYELGDIALEQGDTSAFFQYMVRANRIRPTFSFPLQELKAQAEKRGVTDFEEFYRSLSDAIPFETMPLPEGTPATLAGTEGTTIQLTGKRKKPLLLFFTTSTCSPCKILYKAMLEEMKNNPNKYDVDICLVFPNNDKGFAGYVQANGGKAKNVYFAESSHLHSVFGVSAVPDVAVINRNGEITGFVRGAGPNDNVVSLLSAAK